MRRGRESGQAMIETAIVMPLFVFIILGTIQLGLMHQARLLTKYAAFKAVRAGSLYHAKKEVMQRAALAVLLPMVSEDRGGRDFMKKTSNATEYAQHIMDGDVMANMVGMSSGIPIADVTICGPTKAKQSFGNTQYGVSFDDPDTGTGGSWETFQRTKLSVQVTFNYRMPIPFANMMLYNIVRGQEKADLLWVTRTGPDATQLKANISRPMHDSYAQSGQGYVLPIRASYTMRMMSDLYPDESGFEIPQDNECVVPFAKQ